MSRRLVRVAVRGDAAAIAGVHVRAWQAGYRGLLPDAELDGLSIAGRTRNWLEWLGASGERLVTLVAEECGVVVGFCALLTPSHDDDAAPRTAEVGALYVEPERWRAGVGTALLDRGVELLVNEGWDTATLWVFEANRRARSFYERVGFAADGASKRYDGSVALEDPPRELRLRARLP
jgi:GNAT superfamily N-acetyltransferase